MSFVQGSHVSLSARPADGKEKQMKDGCGKMSETASAFFDPGTSSWRMSQASLLSEASESLERLPAWGMTANGGLFEHPTPGHLIAVRDGSVLPNLPTPRAQPGGLWIRPLDEPQNLENAIARLLPTPTSQAAKHGPTPDIQRKGGPIKVGTKCNLWDLPHLLPTPTSVDAKVFGPNVDWQLRLTNHAPHTASVLMNLPSNDGNTSSDDQHPPPPMIEDSDPSSSSG